MAHMYVFKAQVQYAHKIKEKKNTTTTSMERKEGKQTALEGNPSYHFTPTFFTMSDPQMELSTTTFLPH